MNTRNNKKHEQATELPTKISHQDLPQLIAATAKALRGEGLSESQIQLALLAICGVRVEGRDLSTFRVHGSLS